MKVFTDAELLKTDFQYPSGNLYPRELVERALAEGGSFMRRLRLGAVRGEISYPDKSGINEPDHIYAARVMTIDEARVSHSISDVRLDHDGVLRGQVWVGGPWGEYLAAHPKATFGLRALIRHHIVNGRTVVSNLNIITFDVVRPLTM
jgi:hypothetical protein